MRSQDLIDCGKMPKITVHDLLTHRELFEEIGIELFRRNEGVLNSV